MLMMQPFPAKRTLLREETVLRSVFAAVVPPGSVGYKRARDLEVCIECDARFDWTEVEVFGVCGDCQRALCPDCFERASTCEVCDAKEAAGKDILAVLAVCCSECMTGCDDCEEADPENDAIIHECCLAEHMKTCSQKSRTQRKLSFAKQTILDQETALKKAKLDLAETKKRIDTIEDTLKKARKAKVAAEKELKAHH